jgi:hypothetical protein
MLTVMPISSAKAVTFVLVKTFISNYVTHATTWVLNIASSSWDQMNVTMKHCLSRNFATVHSNVEALDL